LSNPGIANPVVSVTDTMTYILTVTEPGGCYGRDTINIAPYPFLGIDAGSDTTVAVGQTIQLSASGGLFDTYSWMPVTGFDDPTSQSPFLTITAEQVYYVTGTTVNGCIESDSLRISTASNLVIYTGFTPNGDGVNDYWDIDNVAFYPNITIEVFNRWGAMIFSSKGYSSENRWDGTYNGKDVPIGTYYYIINLNDESGTIEKGPVTIVR
jgi:gliding motility-associated-like protein